MVFEKNIGGFLSKRVKAKSATLLITGLLIISTFISLTTVDTATAATQGNDLRLKWTASVYGGGEDILTYDVLPQYPGEEVFHAAGPVQPSSTPGRVTCLNGVTGATIWSVNVVGIGDTCQIQMADINKDGVMEIIVPLQVPAGLIVLDARNGNTIWRAPGSYGGNLGYITPIGGRIDSGPVIGDIDGDGYPTIFVGVMAYEEQPSTGKLVSYKWSSTSNTLVERARTTVWHPCAGGLTLGDTDNDGVFELYMNERDQLFGDGSWGYGLTSFWAANLSRRWQIYDWGASSNKPMLADVNKDGILDVVSTNLGSGICVLNSTDGRPLTGKNGVVLYDQNLGLPVHYQSSIADVDGDGHLELLCADGEHYVSYLAYGYIIPNDTEIWDLNDWKLDAKLNTGICWKGPTIGNVTGNGDGLMDIIAISYDVGPYLNETINNSTIQVYHYQNGVYTLKDEVDGLRYRALYGVCQDIDGDGLNELLVLSQGGVIYCYDTQGKASQPRARSEVEYYSESRLGVSEYVPYIRDWPYIESPISPVPNAVGVSTSISQLQFKLYHPSNQLMSYSVASWPNIIVGSGSGSGVGNGVITIPVSGLTSSTQYHWQVNATDQSGHKLSRDYYFTTAPYTPNSPPTQGTPSIAYPGIIKASNQTTADVDGDKVTNIYNWLRNGASITNLYLPFNTKTSPADEYSGFALTKDYSGVGTYGNVFGASWIPNGVVGGAYSFDGNDYIRVNETGNNLGGSGTWNQMTLELWVKAATQNNDVKLVWKPDRYEESNINSYELDLGYISPTQLQYTWLISIGANTYSTSYTQTVNPTNWHLIDCTYKSGSGLKIYVDGALGANSASVTGNINGTSGPLEIAFNDAMGARFVGSIDEFKIYPLALSSGQIQQNYNDATNGSSNSSTVAASQLVTGDTWSCRVTPNDGLEDGTTRTTSTVTVGALPVWFNLQVQASGSGTTDPAGSSQYLNGTVVQVSATPSGSDWVFDHWVLNGTNVGGANPYPLTMDANYNFTAVFTDNVLFSNNFESGDFSNWNGITTTGTSTATVTTNLPHTGAYSGEYNINTGSGTRRAYSYVNLNSGSTLYAQAYVNIGDGLPLTSGTSMWLIQFVDSSGTALASYGIRADSSGPHWAVQMGNSPYALAASSVAQPTEGNWYLVEAYYTHAATGKTLTISVNGVEVASISRDTSAANAVGSVRLGLAYYANNAAARVYADDVLVSLTEAPTQTFNVNLNSQQDNSATNNLGTVTFDGTDYTLPNSASEEANTYTVTYNPAAGYTFSSWQVNGAASIGSSTSQTTTVTLSGDATIGAIYTVVPTTNSLTISTQGSGTTNPAAGTYTYAQNANVNVNAIESDGNYNFDHWLLNGTDVGSANPYSLVMSGNWDLTAVFVLAPPTHLFEDGFESGSFSAWTGTTTTTGGSVTVNSALANSGLYSGSYSITAGTGTRRAYSYETFSSPQATVNATAYIYIADGLPLTASQSLWLIQFADSSGAALASFGARADSTGTVHWAVQSGSSPNNMSASGPVEGQWYRLDVYFTHVASGKSMVIAVNGVEVASLSVNTSAANNVASLRDGVVYYSTNAIANIRIDDVVVN